MRFDGTITDWNDDRGFGFIRPAQGGGDVFVHAKAFRARGARPQAGQRVSFEIQLDRAGRKRATAVVPARAAAPARRPRRARATDWGGASYFAIPAFVLVLLAASVLWKLPVWAAGWYVIASVVAFAAYAIDKSAAVAGRWRVPESHLLLVGLACGWPGAILAQQVLRHKSAKATFRAAFWGTVAINVLAFLALASPLRGRFLIG